MKFTATILDTDLVELRALAFSEPGLEGAAFVLCSVSETENEHRFLIRSIVPIAAEDYLQRLPDFLSLDSASYVRAAKQAKQSGLSVLFVHSHPGGFLAYSRQDDKEEPKLQDFLHARLPEKVHGSLVLTESGLIGRVWVDGQFVDMSRIRVIGKRFSFHDKDGGVGFLPYFDRQVRAFGPDIQKVLQTLHIGIVGVGGTGSALAEQVIRLGVGEITVFDGDEFEESNVNRVFGSGVEDQGRKKTELVRDNVQKIGVGTKINVVSDHISKLKAAVLLKNCDLVFGCTDKEAPRGLLVQLALRYLIPVIDMGVKVDSKDGHIRDVVGRVTTMYPGEACLFCRGRISADGILYESMNPEERAARAAEGYAPELGTPNPAVVTFTSMVASLAINELLHRLTGFMGDDRASTEVMCFFDKLEFKRNRSKPEDGCLCSVKSNWARGDSKLFLGVTWGN